MQLRENPLSAKTINYEKMSKKYKIQLESYKQTNKQTNKTNINNSKENKNIENRNLKHCQHSKETKISIFFLSKIYSLYINHLLLLIGLCNK